MSAIVTYNLTKYFGETKAVDSLSITVNEGEIFSILGPNGAGKTTTVRMLVGLLRPTFGGATVLGHNVLYEDQQIRERVGFLTETPSIYERLSVKQNLEFFGKLYNVEPTELKERINFLTNLFALKEKLDKPAGTLSKGMKQKLAISRALLHNPDLLFLDEPTSSLSPEAAKTVREEILALAKHEKRTFVICTHNLFEAEILSTKVAIMNKGKIVAVGQPNELKDLLKKDAYVEFRFKELKPKLINYFKDKNIEVLAEARDTHRLSVKIDDIENIVPTVIRDLVQLNAEIVEVKHVRPSLERIYLELIEGSE